MFSVGTKSASINEQHNGQRPLVWNIHVIYLTVFVCNNGKNICLTSLTRAKPKEKMEFPA